MRILKDNLNPLYIRSSIAKTNIANLISESKYLPEKQLLALLTAITRMVEHKMELSPKSDVLINLDYETTGTTCDNRLSDIYLSANKFYSSSIIIKCSITAASASWLETIFTEICLRNRDRFQLCWGIIKNHYLKTIGDEDCKVSYIAERYVDST